MKYLWNILGIYLAFLLQSLLFENLKIFSCSPDIMITVLVICAVALDFVPAAVVGAFAGVLTDTMYGSVFGINVLVYMFFALLTSLAADKKNLNSPLIMSWICFVSIAALEIVLAVLKSVLVGYTNIGVLCTNIFVKGIFAALLALLSVLFVENMKKRRCREASLETASEKEAGV